MFLFRQTIITKCLVITRLQEISIFKGKLESTTRSKQRTRISSNVILLENHLIKMKRLSNLIISIIYFQISLNGFLLRCEKNIDRKSHFSRFCICKTPTSIVRIATSIYDTITRSRIKYPANISHQRSFNLGKTNRQIIGRLEFQKGNSSL